MTNEKKLARRLIELNVTEWQLHELARELVEAHGAVWRVATGTATTADRLELARVISSLRNPPAPDARCVENWR